MSVDDPTRVLFFVETFWPALGGAEVQASRFIEAMTPRGYEFTVITSQEDGAPAVEEHRGVSIHRFPFKRAFQKNDVELVMEIRRQISELVRSVRPHVLHTICYRAAVFFVRYARADATPFLFEVCFEMWDSASDDTSVFGRALREANWVTTNSGAMLKHLHQLAPEITARSSLIYYGIEPPALQPAPLAFDPPRVLCFGRLVEEKGFDAALLAFAEILKRFPDAQLDIAGDGNTRAELEELAQHLGIAHAATFLGWVQPEDIPELINTATLVLMPSRWEEAFGLVAVETALMERPIIGTNVGGLPEAIQHGQTGMIVEKDGVEAMAQTAIDLLERPHEAVRLGRGGRERALRDFSPNRYADQYDALYVRITDRSDH